MTYAEALERLHGLRRFGMRPGLDTTRHLAASVAHPERTLQFIHVAGTNGKGSTCAFLESVYRQAGYKVGLYTSPHLVSFRERVQVNRRWIPEEAVARLLGNLAPAMTDDPETGATFFECTTVLALQWFREQRCDLVIWETGMGGRLDATNIVTPLASVITSIGWDHMEWLGNTLGAIAREKAGILKPGVPGVVATEEPEAWQAIEETAARVGAPLTRVRPGGPAVARVRGLHHPLAGEHQIQNAALAWTTVDLLAPRFRVTQDQIVNGLATTRWAGRFERRQRGAQTLVLDGAHNRPAFEVLADTVRREFPWRTPAVVLGMLADKDLSAAVDQVVPLAARIVVVPIHSTRAGDPRQLEQACAAVLGADRVTTAPGVAEALRLLEDEPLVLLCGSLYLVGEALMVLDGGEDAERSLSEWSGPR